MHNPENCYIIGIKEPLRSFNSKSQNLKYHQRHTNYFLDKIDPNTRFFDSTSPIFSRKKKFLTKLVITPPSIQVSKKTTKTPTFYSEKKYYKYKPERNKCLVPFENFSFNKISKEFPARNILHSNTLQKKFYDSNVSSPGSSASKERKYSSTGMMNRIRYQESNKRYNKLYTLTNFFDQTVPESIIIQSKSPGFNFD